MANEEETVPDHPGVKPEMQAVWKKHVAETISADPGEGRQYGLMVLEQVGLMLKALATGMAPSEVVKLVQPNTTFVMMEAVVKNIAVFSVHGEAFRLWWNSWHERVHPSDEPPMPVDQMSDAQRSQWDRRWFVPEKDEKGRVILDEDEQPRYIWQPPIFTPWHVNVIGRPVVLPGTFDPNLPLTKSPDYQDKVKAIYQKFKQEAAAPA